MQDGCERDGLQASWRLAGDLCQELFKNATNMGSKWRPNALQNEGWGSENVSGGGLEGPLDAKRGLGGFKADF